MLSVFMNRKGDVLFTYPSVDLHPGDKVKFDKKIYLIVTRTLNYQNGFYEIILHESAETEND